MQETISEEDLERIQMKHYRQTFWVRINAQGAIQEEAYADATEDGRIRKENLKSLGFEIDQRRQG